MYTPGLYAQLCIAEYA